MTEQSDRADVPPDRLMAIIARVKQHRVAQWTVGYVAVAYGIQHGVTLTADAYDWPHAVARASMTALALGVPLAMTLAWYHGERTARRISSGELGVMSVVLLGIAFAFYIFVRPGPDVPTARQASVSGPAATLGNSLAVLPFANVSRDPDQEFFSDGMTDEIMTALAKIPSLNVMARESAFTFKGKNEDIRAIGKALGAAYVVEGSVRKAGDRVRITAQLVRANDGVSLWTDAYDRELKDVFAVQEDVARAIAASLQAPLGLTPGQNLVSNRNISAESYQDYLRAKALHRGRAIGDAIKLLEPIVAREPDFAPAWALLARSYALATIYGPLRTGRAREVREAGQSFLEKGGKAAREAIRLDPHSSDGYAALGMVQQQATHWADSEEFFRKALEIDPDNTDALETSGISLTWFGRIKEAAVVADKLHRLDPFVPMYTLIAANIMQAAGNSAAALPMIQAVSGDAAGVYYRDLFLAEAYAAQHRYADAADALLAIHSDDLIDRKSVEAAAAIIRTAPVKARDPAALPELQGELGFVYAYVGVPERVLDYPERMYSMGFMDTLALVSLWSPEMAPVRKSDRFRVLVRKTGLLEYWKTKGWPDLCHPTTGDDFECS